MFSSLVRNTPPVVLPVSLAEAKVMLTLAVDIDEADLLPEHDTAVRSAIVGAAATAEVEAGKTVVYSGYDLFLDRWPKGKSIGLPLPPFRKLDSVTYWTVDDQEFTFDRFYIDNTSLIPQVVLRHDEHWPVGDLREVKPIRVRYWAGMIVPFSANSDTNELLVANNPFTDGDTVRLSVSGGVLPEGLETWKLYFVRDVAGDSLRLSENLDGDAVSFANTGAGSLFLGEIDPLVATGLQIMIAGLYETSRDPEQTSTAKYHRAASHWFAMDSTRGVI
ncbi:hypothetical protein JWJ90_13590 [Desulfobulbus rhabdoformis]|uniref:hypothetical protein n=1 Tax=Desulfobulbus rhabdoformis TaxID=34032 RepID=UPI001964BAD4|nr:hypothetical protein [Desulfobulbus rhabdoformis]MBM9615312.1 hypothetical protein [Desulfobulbus rhabdoformis]